MRHLLARADARLIPLADGVVQCCACSPPYWSLRDYGCPGQIGLEPNLAGYVAALVAVGREVRRVLRDDGVWWLNLGDSYNGSPPGNAPGTGRASSGLAGNTAENIEKRRVNLGHKRLMSTLKPKDLLGVPWAVAFALRDDGWFLRSDIIWSKPSPMPESVTDRPTRAHEYVFLLAKRERYYYDAAAVRQPSSPTNDRGNRNAFRGGGDYTGGRSFANGGRTGVNDVPGCDGEPSGRNLRSVWEVASTPYPGAHFATWPPALVRPMIEAGSSAKGCCPACRAPYRRLVDKKRTATRPGTDSKLNGMNVSEMVGRGPASNVTGYRDPRRHVTEVRTVGWGTGCTCSAGPPVPCLILDPFCGSGTTGAVATGLGRDFIGLDLSAEYLRLARHRIERPASPPPSADEPVMPLFAGLEGS
jgi:DNA modification methylase